jgi:hypothetical protein
MGTNLAHNSEIHKNSLYVGTISKSNRSWKQIVANSIHLTHIYMTARFPVLVQALQ